ncbi:MAG: alpha/beta family hydrolase [Myxococcota bacterium]
MYAWHGPTDSPDFLVLAPGDQAQLDDDAPKAIAQGLGEAGVRVVRFPFPYCETSDGARRDALLAEHIREAAALKAPSQRLILGGLSRGARVSGELANDLGAIALLAFAYPFHPRHDPDPGQRAKALGELTVPVMLFQGTRDSRGNRQQVLGYGLPNHVQVHWLDDANHALEPRLRSGHTQADQLAQAVTLAASFLEATRGTTQGSCGSVAS